MFPSRIANIISVIVAFLVIASIAYFWRGDRKEEKRAAIGGTAGLEVSENPQAMAGNQTYTNPDYHFSFLYPNGFRVHALKDEHSGGDVITVEEDFQQNEKTTSPEDTPGFQIFISPFDEEGPITRDRILQDVPDMVIDDPKEVIVGKNQIHALIFFSQDETLGRMREVWFRRNAHLYQISARAQFDSWLSGILTNFTFSE